MAHLEEVGVHSVYQDAISTRESLDSILTDLGNARDKRRSLDFQKTDRELELLQIESGVHTEFSVAAMDRHLKTVYHNDKTLREIRQQLVQVSDEIDGLELDKHMADTDIRIAAARLGELGGYLQYIAVVKQADETRKANEANTDDPWRTT